MPQFHIGDFSWLPRAWEAALILIGGFIVSRGLTALMVRGLRFLDPQAHMILKKVLFYSFFGAFLGWSLHRLGVDFKLLIGAAGVFSVAIGFASQTSASNLISGIFLIMEKPFVVGDTIRVGDWEGVVLSIDLLSSRIRTYDNLMVRIPNESLMKSGITNLTRFPIRRVDIILNIPFRQDLKRIENILLDLAHREPLCLDEPQPLFSIQELVEAAIVIKFCVWTTNSQYVKFKTQFIVSLTECLKQENVSLAIPRRHLELSSESRAFFTN